MRKRSSQKRKDLQVCPASCDFLFHPTAGLLEGDTHIQGPSLLSMSSILGQTSKETQGVHQSYIPINPVKLRGKTTHTTSTGFVVMAQMSCGSFYEQRDTLNVLCVQTSVLGAVHIVTNSH